MRWLLGIVCFFARHDGVVIATQFRPGRDLIACRRCPAHWEVTVRVRNLR